MVVSSYKEHTIKLRMVSKKRVDEVNLYLFVLDLLSQGKTPAQIEKEYAISKQKIYYYTTRLKKEGIIKKKQNGIWEVVQTHFEHTRTFKKREIRGHAFIWKIKIPKELGKKWKDLLKEKKIVFKIQGNGTIRAFIDNKKLWFGKESIIVYETDSFYGENAIQSRKYAVISLIETLQKLSNKLNINLVRYPFKSSREHFGMIRNDLAQQVNRNGEKIKIRDDVDGEWLWIDDSEGMFGELETGGKGISKDRAGLNKSVQDWYNDHKKHNFKVTPSFILDSIGGLVKNNQMYMQNIESHINSVKLLGSSAEANSISTELLAKSVKEMQEAFIEQIEMLRKEVSQLKNSSKDL